MERSASKLKTAVLHLGERHIALGNALRAVQDTARSLRFHLRTWRVKTQEKTVVFCAFEGRSYADSPRAIFEYMAGCGAFADWTLIWGMAGDPSSGNQILSGGGRKPKDAGPSVSVVPYGGAEWEKALSSAKYWVLNYKVKDYLKPKADQVFVQTWHGTPLKRLGYDLAHFDSPRNTAEGNARHYGTEVKKFTYFLSPSPYASEKFRSAWRMEAHGKEDIILEEGYPRNDMLVRPSDARVRALRMRLFGTEEMSKKVILYAPTYRQAQQETGKGYTYALPFDPAAMYEALSDEYVVLFRAHYYITDRVDFSAYEGFLYDVSGVDEVNELCLVSDLLVTDYSSVMFDYALLGRPMIFYMYDLEYYRDASNGFYFDPEEVLPGPIVRTQEALYAAVRSAQTDRAAYADRYEAFRERFCPKEDGCAAQRVVEEIFRKT